MKFTFVDLEKLYAQDPKLKREDIQILEEWVNKQPHLAQVKVTELQLVLFLHSCYYKIELTKTTIDNYFTLKTQYPDLLDALPLEVFVKNSSVALFNLLPQKTHEDYVVMFIKLLDNKVDNFNCVNLIKALIMTSVLNLHKEGFVEGIVVVFDMKGYTLGHLTRMNLMAMKRGLLFLQEASPIRLKSVHFINIVPFMDKAVGIAKPFLKPELYNMLMFHQSLDTLHKYVPIKCLPEEYGGSQSSVHTLNENSVKKIVENYDFFSWHDAQKVDESKRCGKSNNINDDFGLEGSFKKLEID